MSSVKAPVEEVNWENQLYTVGIAVMVEVNLTATYQETYCVSRLQVSGTREKENGAVLEDSRIPLMLIFAAAENIQTTWEQRVQYLHILGRIGN